MPKEQKEQIAPTLRKWAVPMDSVAPDPANARLHPEANLDAIRGSLLAFGQQKPIIVDKAGVIVAGSGLYLAARALGWKRIAAVRTDLAGAKRTAFALADNRTSEMAEWNNEVLARAVTELAEEVDLDTLGFSAEELAKLLGPAGPAEGLTDPDAVPEPPKTPVTKSGDLYLLGDHRLLCGDSTKAEDVARLMGKEKAGVMNTDPPYGVNYAAIKNGIPRSGFRDIQARGGDIENDDLTAGPELQAFLESAIRAAVPHLIERPAFYFWHPMLTQGTFFAAAAADILIHRQIIWVKPRMVLTRSGMYHWKHELCFYGWIRGKMPAWYGDKGQVSVWECGDPQRGHMHPTQKPVELFIRPMKNHLTGRGIAYEPFAGSGSQFIAAEQLGRRCYGLEIAPVYCDVIVRRWEEFTGQKARRKKGHG